jgi:signal transduction histidine kinase
MTGFFFIARRLFGWMVLLIAGLVFIAVIRGPIGIYLLICLGLLIMVLAGYIDHVRRVRMIKPDFDGEALRNRHRRQFEIPFPAEDAFAMVEAAIRELPYAEEVESARDSLQAHAYVLAVDPNRPGRRRKTRQRRNLVHAAVTPAGSAASATIVCEPSATIWFDWLLVDWGANLENVEAVSRAITRRVAERRKLEEARTRETETEKELTVAKLSLLHAQVEPHFLYNTLANAQLLTRSDPAKADQMLGNLIAYLRHSLPRADTKLSTLGEELEATRAYFDILKIRMGERLATQLQVPEQLKPVPLPPMMLQTLAENAIKHGLEPVPGGGNIWITARLAGEKLSVTVADDGRGFAEEGGGTGIGLKNVRERLRLAYGDEASLAIGANFPKGVAATITVPLAGPTGGLHA